MNCSRNLNHSRQFKEKKEAKMFQVMGTQNKDIIFWSLRIIWPPGDIPLLSLVR
jgi:hypothetical protein